MEIDGHDFRYQLLHVLKHISNATFVSFDLEMSGINTRRGDRSHDVGKPTLQQQYEEMKEAAETFQVLQLGITCVEEDRDKEFYLARPFNFNVSPLFLWDRAFDIDRRIVFSSSATDFLQREGFDFGKVFRSGVPYMSIEEESEARKNYQHRINSTSSIPDVIISPSDVEALGFYRSARATINKWIKAPAPKDSYVNIHPASGNEDEPLNGYQRRLTYQLVRNEFSEYRVFGRLDGHFMQVSKREPVKEEKEKNRKMAGFNDQIARQTGLRWIFEALTGGDLSAIDPVWFYRAKQDDNDKPEVTMSVIEAELTKVISTLKTKKHTIVGHNLFTDLGFLFNTFVGELPDEASLFQEYIHKLFPTIIDTKFLATYGMTSMSSRSNLASLLEPFRKIHQPLILLHEEHSSYGSVAGKSHEAGFDSWMTAELFVKLAAQLYYQTQLAKHQRPANDNTSPGAKTVEMLTKLGNPPTISNDSGSDTGSGSDNDSEGGSGGAPLNPPDTNGMFSSRDSVNGDSPHSANLHALQLDKGEGQWGKADEAPSPKLEQWLPAMDDEFWDKYTNKLRVTAIEGGVCDLAEGEVSEEEA